MGDKRPDVVFVGRVEAAKAACGIPPKQPIGSYDWAAAPAMSAVEDEEVASAFEAEWGAPLSRQKGMKIPEMFDAAVAGELRAMYIFGEDVAQTDPNTAHVAAALESLEFLVCQDIFETETTSYADVILPASSFLEKHGTFTNAERRLQLVNPAIDRPTGSRSLPRGPRV